MVSSPPRASYQGFCFDGTSARVSMNWGLAASKVSHSGVRILHITRASRLPYRLSIQHGGSGERARLLGSWSCIRTVQVVREFKADA